MDVAELDADVVAVLETEALMVEVAEDEGEEEPVDVTVVVAESDTVEDAEDEPLSVAVVEIEVVSVAEADVVCVDERVVARLLDAVDVWVLSEQVRNDPDWYASTAALRAETASQPTLKSFRSPVGLQTIESAGTVFKSNSVKSEATADSVAAVASQESTATDKTGTPVPATSRQSNLTSSPLHVCTSRWSFSASGQHC